jgi:hypothetical protein
LPTDSGIKIPEYLRLAPIQRPEEKPAQNKVIA